MQNCNQPAETRKRLYKIKPERSQRKGNHALAARTLEERVEYYDLISNLAQKNAGIPIGPLLGGDANEAEVNVRCILSSYR